MFKPTVNVIKKKQDTHIPLIGTSTEVKNEIERYCDEIDKEIDYIRSISRNKNYNLNDGAFIYAEGGYGYYQFPNYQFLNFAPDTGAIFTINTTTRYGYISYCSSEYIEICIQGYTDPIDSLSMSIDSSKLTQALSDRVKNLDTGNALLRMLVDGGIRSKSTEGAPITGFEAAKKMVEEGFISMIWGPPGTGKTYTLANLALDYMAKEKRVLIMSQSNISVDGAVLKIIDIAEKRGERENITGKVFRYGMAREQSLYDNEDFCAKLYARNRNPGLKDVLEDADKVLHLANEPKNISVAERKLLAAIQKLLTRSDITQTIKDGLVNTADTIKTKECTFVWLKKQAQTLRAICNGVLVNEEDNCIRKASIVATTATKATLTNAFKDMKWDIVFFDEVSMAFVPQIMVASTLAREKLILLGDFRQLAPIVQFSSTSILRKDIFTYLHATDGMGGVKNHPWLTMLDEQRRMHPDIADFVSTNLYSGKLRTAKGIKEKVQAVTDNAPFENKVFALVDHSEFQALCYTTRSGSRYNPLSAVISIRLALKALEKMDISIGIITPYQAQARLLSAMVKDEEEVMGKLDILCSTVHQFQGFEKDLIIFDTVESEPKRETGKLFVDGEEIDDATRLVNVAVTRARGKFIVVANYNYLNKHSSDISKEMSELLEISKISMRFSWNNLLDFLSTTEKSCLVRCYRSESDALADFHGAISKGTKEKKLTYWHSTRNELRFTTELPRKVFLEDLRNARQHWRTSNVFNGSGTKKPLSDIIFPYFNPTDDYLIGEDTFVWFGVPLCVNNNYGKRLPYVIKGKNATSVFETLCSHETARREWKNHLRNIQLGQSGFSIFISDKYDCPKCHKGSKVLKTKKDKYVIVCNECGEYLNPFIPHDIIEDYMKEKDIRCKICGAPFKIGKYDKPFCSKDWKHKTSLTLDDVFS